MALRFLEQKGFVLVARGWYCRRGEIDLVMERQGTVVFVEVKLRSSHAFGSPAEAINWLKMRRFMTAVGEYLRQNRVVRFQMDAVLIYMDSRARLAKISHLEDVSIG